MLTNVFIAVVKSNFLLRLPNIFLSVQMNFNSINIIYYQKLRRIVLVIEVKIIK